jgi:hypothetical protein
MSAEKTYKATFRKSDDGLAINSHKAPKEELTDWIAKEAKELFEGDVAPDGFVIEVVPDEC